LSLIGLEDQGKHQSQLDEDLEPEQGSLKGKRREGEFKFQMSLHCFRFLSLEMTSHNKQHYPEGECF